MKVLIPFDLRIPSLKKKLCVCVCVSFFISVNRRLLASLSLGKRALKNACGMYVGHQVAFKITVMNII